MAPTASYATMAQLAARFGAEELADLTDRTGSGVADPAVVATALADAQAVINAHLATRYAVPVDPVPPLLERLACDIARGLLWKDRPTEAVRAAHADALDLLARLSAGRAVLEGAAPVQAGSVPAAPAGQVRVTGGDRLLSRPSLAEFLG